jgi:NPCBM/NEW2 domain
MGHWWQSSTREAKVGILSLIVALLALPPAWLALNSTAGASNSSANNVVPTPGSLDSQSGVGTSSTGAGQEESAASASAQGGEKNSANFTYLSDLEPVAGNAVGTIPGTNATIRGKDYPHSVLIFCLGGRDNDFEYDLGTKGTRLLATAGIGDDEDARDLPANVSFYGDGKLLKTVKVSLGRPKQVDVDISGILRLRIAATLVQSVYDGRNITVAIGDARFSSQ